MLNHPIPNFPKRRGQKLMKWIQLALMAGLALGGTLTGCAPQYHEYQGVVAPYGYCAPRPLPFEQYPPPACPIQGAEYEQAPWVPQAIVAPPVQPEPNSPQTEPSPPESLAPDPQSSDPNEPVLKLKLG